MRRRRRSKRRRRRRRRRTYSKQAQCIHFRYGINSHRSTTKGVRGGGGKGGRGGGND